MFTKYLCPDFVNLMKTQLWENATEFPLTLDGNSGRWKKRKKADK
jgi:hypothetical protein